MSYLPIFVDLEGRNCLVIGGEGSAESRVKALCEAGASVTVIAPEITPALMAMADAGMIRWIARGYTAGDMRARFMAWVATVINEATRCAAVADAHELGVLINVADRPVLCDFITPAVVKRGKVQVAISTGGTSPALARRLREQIEGVVGPEYEPVGKLLRSARRWLRGRVSDPSERARILSKLVASDLIEALKQGDRATAERLVRAHLGADFAELGFTTEGAPAASEEALTPARTGDA